MLLPLLFLPLVLAAACGSSSGSNGLAAPRPSASGPSIPAPSTSGPTTPSERTVSAAVAALAETVHRARPPRGQTVFVTDQQPTTGCRRPGEPGEAVDLVGGQFHCGAITAQGPPPLTPAQRAAIVAELVGQPVRFVRSGSYTPAGQGVAVTVDRVLVTGQHALVSVLRRIDGGETGVLRIRLAWQAESWRPY